MHFLFRYFQLTMGLLGHNSIEGDQYLKVAKRVLITRNKLDVK